MVGDCGYDVSPFRDFFASFYTVVVVKAVTVQEKSRAGIGEYGV